MGLPVLTDSKGKSYDSILIIIDRLIKMIYYKLIKITIDTPGLAEIINDIVVQHHDLPNSIITN